MNAAFLSNLQERLGADGLLTSASSMAHFAKEQRGQYHSEPLAVALPETVEDVQAIVRLAQEQGVPVIPQGGNTGLVGGTVARQRGELIINLERLNRIIEVDTQNYSLTVEAGCTLAAVKSAALAHDRYFALGLSVADMCQIGGNIASNAGGTNVLRYGNTREQVLGLEVVLPNGDVWSDLRGLRKNNLGLDLKQLFIGSEGTLGIITKACLRLFPALKHRLTVILGLDSIQQVLDAYQQARTLCNDTLNAFELLPHEGIEMVLAHRPKLQDPLTTAYPYYVVMEVATSQPRQDDLGTIVASIADTMGYPYHLATTPADHDNIWSIRGELPWVQREEGASLKHDIALPLSRLNAFMIEASEAVLKHLPATRIIAFGHVGDGNLHYNLMQPKTMEKDAFLKERDAFADIIHTLALKHGGTVSAEHGIGLQKRDLLDKLASTSERWLRQAVKRAIDPLNIMNTGKSI